jgi:hypothetical protein
MNSSQGPESISSFEPERASGSWKREEKATHPLASKRSFLASTLTTQPSWPPRLATCPLRPPVTPAPADVAVKARRSNTLMRLSSEPVMRRFEVKEMERIGAAWAVCPDAGKESALSFQSVPVQVCP